MRRGEDQEDAEDILEFQTVSNIQYCKDVIYGGEIQEEAKPAVTTDVVSRSACFMNHAAADCRRIFSL